MRIGTCLLCFAENIKIFDIKNTKLQSVYEEITDSKIHNDYHYLCYICQAKLHQCYLLIKKMLNLQKNSQDGMENESLVLTKFKLDNASFDGISLANGIKIKQEQDDYVEENSNFRNAEYGVDVKTEPCSSSYNDSRQETHAEKATPRPTRAAKLKCMQKVPQIIQEEQNYQLMQQNMHARERLANETEEERKKRLDYKRRRAERMANESYEERQKRLEDLRRRAAQRLANETRQQRNKRLADLRQRMAQRIANETKEQREKRLEQLRINQRKREKRDSLLTYLSIKSYSCKKKSKALSETL